MTNTIEMDVVDRVDSDDHVQTWTVLNWVGRFGG
jgi:hypothetical protein